MQKRGLDVKTDVLLLMITSKTWQLKVSVFGLKDQFYRFVLGLVLTRTERLKGLLLFRFFVVDKKCFNINEKFVRSFAN